MDLSKGALHEKKDRGGPVFPLVGNYQYLFLENSKMTFQKVFFKKKKTPGGGACISFNVKLPKHFALLQQSLRYVSKQLEPE